MGVTHSRTLLSASSISFTILLTPQTRMTFLGPKIIAATRLPVPSMLKSFPSSVTALLLLRKTSARRTSRRILNPSSKESPGAKGFSSWMGCLLLIFYSCSLIDLRNLR